MLAESLRLLVLAAFAPVAIAQSAATTSSLHAPASGCVAVASYASKVAATDTTPLPQGVRLSDGLDPDTGPSLRAKDAYDCLSSIPLNKTVAKNFMTAYKTTLGFQSTLAYLKSPPPSYQQPAVDIMGGLEAIENALEGGIYQNEWQWEMAIQSLVQSAHDGHMTLIAGATGIFRFSSPISLVTLSADGHQLPEVYSANDMIAAQRDQSWVPSSISKINGEDAVTWIAANAQNNTDGGRGPLVDWNMMMFTAVEEITGRPNGLTSTLFYPGETFTVEFKNGSIISQPNIALLNTLQRPSVEVSKLMELTSGEEYYSAFVIQSPATSTSTSGGSATATNSATSQSTAQPKPWKGTAYPRNPFQVQEGGQMGKSTWLTSYAFPESSLAVLSIPSFIMTGESAQTYSDFIAKFLTQSKQAGLKKILIDLSSNPGGTALLTYDAFKIFFPQLQPFGGARFRATDQSNALGTTLSTYFVKNANNYSKDANLEMSPWVATLYLDAASNKSFSSWADMYGPRPDHGDEFSNVFQQSLSDAPFTKTSTGNNGSNGIVIPGYGNAPDTPSNTALYSAEDIVLFGNGDCQSSCSLFMELFHHQAGVKVVVAGGSPEPGPMQALGGVRGAQNSDMATLVGNIEAAVKINGSVAAFFPSQFLSTPSAPTLSVTDAGFNLWDQIREGQFFPLQFAYEAADCRIWYTPETFNNYSALWQYAADAIWNTPSNCVPGSTNQTAYQGVTPGAVQGSQAFANDGSRCYGITVCWSIVVMAGLVIFMFG